MSPAADGHNRAALDVIDQPTSGILVTDNYSERDVAGAEWLAAGGQQAMLLTGGVMSIVGGGW